MYKNYPEIIQNKLLGQHGRISQRGNVLAIISPISGGVKSTARAKLNSILAETIGLVHYGVLLPYSKQEDYNHALMALNYCGAELININIRALVLKMRRSMPSKLLITPEIGLRMHEDVRFMLLSTIAEAAHGICGWEYNCTREEYVGILKSLHCPAVLVNKPHIGDVFEEDIDLNVGGRL